jgi:hypothetical protein
MIHSLNWLVACIPIMSMYSPEVSLLGPMPIFAFTEVIFGVQVKVNSRSPFGRSLFTKDENTPASTSEIPGAAKVPIIAL